MNLHQGVKANAPSEILRCVLGAIRRVQTPPSCPSARGKHQRRVAATVGQRLAGSRCNPQETDASMATLVHALRHARVGTYRYTTTSKRSTEQTRCLFKYHEVCPESDRLLATNSITKNSHPAITSERRHRPTSRTSHQRHPKRTIKTSMSNPKAHLTPAHASDMQPAMLQDTSYSNDHESIIIGRSSNRTNCPSHSATPQKFQSSFKHRQKKHQHSVSLKTGNPGTCLHSDR